MKTLTTAQAAELAGLAQSSFRGEATRAAQKGTDLHAPREVWPDARTPLWDEKKVRAWFASRPGPGRWKSTRSTS